MSQSQDKKKNKRAYQKPEIKSEKVTVASMAKACNNTHTSNRKAVAPCVTLLS